MRSSNTQLPSAQELMEILADESQRRAVRYDFLQLHPHLFDAYRQLADRAGIDAGWITMYPQLELETLGQAVASTTEILCACIVTDEVEQTVLDEMFDTLAMQDMAEKSDAIFVFGSPADARIAHAVELYHDDIAPLLIVSGKGPHYGRNELSEAERMAQFAIENGVPESAIMIEPASITLPDNVKRTLDMWELQQFRPRKLCIVATSYIMQRACMEWYKFTPWDIEIIASPASAQSPELRRDTWHQSERGIRMLLNEYAKMILEHKIDIMRKNHG